MHTLLEGRHEGEAAGSQTGAEASSQVKCGPTRPQLAPLAAPSRLWTAPSQPQHHPPTTGSVNSTHSPQAVPREVRNRKLPQRKLGNGVCVPLRSQAENSTTLAGKRSAPGGNAPWAMESSTDVSLCACAAGGDSVQPRRGSVVKHAGCCSLLAVRTLGAFLSHRFQTVRGKAASSCLPGCPAAPVARERRRGGKGWREATV